MSYILLCVPIHDENLFVLKDAVYITDNYRTVDYTILLIHNVLTIKQ